MNIYLIGMMGVGKSTIGNILSKKLEMPFIDLDHEIEKSAGSSIGKIFRSHGEEFFRNLESIALKNYFNSVISCGGGIILSKQNRSFIKKNGKSVLLMATIDELIKRLSKSNNRPILRRGSSEDILHELWEGRKNLYKQTADFSVETENKTPMQIVEEINIHLRL